MYTAQDLRNDYPSMNPKAGACPPVEAVWRMNVMTADEFHQQMADERERRREANAVAYQGANESRTEALRAELVSSGVPERYVGVPIVSDYNDALKSGKGLWIHGDVGVGKTVKAASIVKGWVDSGGWARMVSAVSLFTELRDSMGSSSEGYVMGRYTNTPLLVLDDLGQERPSEWALSRLFEIIDARYGKRLPIIVTTNYAPAALAERLEENGGVADAIVSRLIEMTVRLRVEGYDRRLP